MSEEVIRYVDLRQERKFLRRKSTKERYQVVGAKGDQFHLENQSKEQFIYPIAMLTALFEEE